jgi:hypothetical protein
MLTLTTKDPYMKAGLLKEAAERGAQLDRQDAVYRSELHPKMQAVGEYVRSREAEKAAALRGKREAEQEFLEAQTLKETKDFEKEQKQKELKFKKEQDLRKEVNKVIGDFPQIVVGYRKMLEVAKEPSAAGDVTLIYGYMKMIDPPSTVREGEAATAKNAAGVSERIRALYNKARKGELLTDEIRADFMRQAGNLYRGANEQYKQITGYYKNLAEQEGLDPGKIIVPMAMPDKYKKGEKRILPDGRVAVYIGDDKWEVD